MPGFYDNLRDVVAARLIKQYGMALTLRRIVKGEYDANTGSNAEDESTDYPCYGVTESYKDNMIAASLVKRGDKKLILSASDLPVAPEIGDQFLFPDGTTWFIPEGNGSTTSSFQPVETIAPGGTAVVHYIQVRK